MQVYKISDDNFARKKIHVNQVKSSFSFVAELAFVMPSIVTPNFMKAIVVFTNWTLFSTYYLINLNYYRL